MANVGDYAHTDHGPGTITEIDRRSRGGTQFRVAGAGFNVWLDERNLHVAKNPWGGSYDIRTTVDSGVHDVNEDNSTTLPYDPSPQFSVDQFRREQTILPGDHEIDPKDRLHPSKSLSRDRTDGNRPYPGPSPDLFAKDAARYYYGGEDEGEEETSSDECPMSHHAGAEDGAFDGDSYKEWGDDEWHDELPDGPERTFGKDAGAHSLPGDQDYSDHEQPRFSGGAHEAWEPSSGPNAGGYAPDRPISVPNVSERNFRPAGLSDRYAQLPDAYDLKDPIVAFKMDPAGVIEARNWAMSGEEERLAAKYADDTNLSEADSSFRTAAWRDVREKAMRLRREGRVEINDMAPDRIYATVKGDNGTYDTMIAKGGSMGGIGGGQSITNWHCDCDWGKWAFARRFSYVGRLCSHAYAAYLDMQSQHMKDNPGHFKTKRYNPGGKNSRFAAIVDDFKKWAKDTNDGHWDDTSVADFINTRHNGVDRDDVESLYDFVDSNRQQAPERDYDIPYTLDNTKAYKTGDALRMRPQSLTPDMRDVPEGEDEHFVDVQKDERETTGPDDIVHFAAIASKLHRTAAPPAQPSDPDGNWVVDQQNGRTRGQPHFVPNTPAPKPAQTTGTAPGGPGGGDPFMAPGHGGTPAAGTSPPAQQNQLHPHPDTPQDPGGNWVVNEQGGRVRGQPNFVPNTPPAQQGAPAGATAPAPGAPPTGAGALGGGPQNLINQIQQRGLAGPGGPAPLPAGTTGAPPGVPGTPGGPSPVAGPKGPSGGNPTQTGESSPLDPNGTGVATHNQLTPGSAYTVQSGDTLSDIAQRAGLGGNYQDLAKSNNISNPNLIHPGDKINLSGAPAGGAAGDIASGMAQAKGAGDTPPAAGTPAANQDIAQGLKAPGATPAAPAAGAPPAAPKPPGDLSMLSPAANKPPAPGAPPAPPAPGAPPAAPGLPKPPGSNDAFKSLTGSQSNRFAYLLHCAENDDDDTRPDTGEAAHDLDRLRDLDDEADDHLGHMDEYNDKIRDLVEELNDAGVDAMPFVANRHLGADDQDYDGEDPTDGNPNFKGRSFPTWADDPFSGSGPDPKLWMTDSGSYVDRHERPDYQDVTDLPDGDIIKYNDSRSKPKQGPASRDARLHYADDDNTGYFNPANPTAEDWEQGSGKPFMDEVGHQADNLVGGGGGGEGGDAGDLASVAEEAPVVVARRAGSGPRNAPRIDPGFRGQSHPQQRQASEPPMDFGYDGVQDPAAYGEPAASPGIGADVVANFQRSAAAGAIFNESATSDDFASSPMVQGFLRTAGRKFTPAEERDLERESHLLGARNLPTEADLDGTHYLLGL